MIKNKKLIAFIAAIAMMFTMLSSFTYASAVTSDEIQQGITLVSDEAEDGMSVTLTIGYKGIEGGVEFGSVLISGVTADVASVAVEGTKASTEEVGYDSAAKTITYTNSKFEGLTGSEGTLRKIVITLNSELTKNIDVQVADDSISTITGNDGKKYTASTASNVPSSYVKFNGVTETIVAVKAPKQAEVEQPAENNDPAPEVLPDVKTITQGYTLEASRVNDKQYKLTIGYTGIEGGVEFGSILISGVTADVDSVAVEGTKASTEEVGYDPTAKTITYTNSKFEGLNGSEGTIRNILINLNTALSSSIQVSVGDDSISTLTGNDGKKYTASTASNVPSTYVKINAANANLEVPEKTGGTEVAIPVDSDKVTGETVSTAGGKKDSDYYIVADVVDAQGNKVDYGKDSNGNDTWVAEVVYTAVNGETQKVELTKGQYENLMAGHLAANNVKALAEKAGINNMSDVINKVKYKMYNSALKVNAQLVQATGDGNIVKDEGTGTQGPAPTYKNPTFSISNTDVKTGAAKEITIPAITYTGAGNTDYDITTSNNYSYKLTLKDGLSLVTGDGIVVNTAVAQPSAGVAAAEAKDVQLTTTTPVYVAAGDKIKFTAAGTAGTIKFNLAVAGTAPNGDAKAYDKDFTVEVKATATDDNNNNNNGGGGSSSSTKGGAIAGGYQSGTTGALPGVSFTDLGDVPWASTAIKTLAMGNIVSGRSDTEFDPNANITRAEYCQILINAIGKQNDYADTQFNDVPTDAWFYHNVAVASQLGIVSGYGDGNFGPYDLITREQMALMTQKAAKVMNVNLTGASVGAFTDDADIADWSKDAVYELANAGIINGMGDGTFAPRANATRAQASVIIYNTFVQK